MIFCVCYVCNKNMIVLVAGARGERHAKGAAQRARRGAPGTHCLLCRWLTYTDCLERFTALHVNYPTLGTLRLPTWQIGHAEGSFLSAWASLCDMRRGVWETNEGLSKLCALVKKRASRAFVGGRIAYIGQPPKLS